MMQTEHEELGAAVQEDRSITGRKGKPTRPSADRSDDFDDINPTGEGPDE